MDGTTAITLTSILSSITEIFTAGISWVGTVSDTVAGNPLMLFCVLISFIGIGIGLFKRLMRV